MSACLGGYPTASIAPQPLLIILLNSVILLPVSFSLLALGPTYITAAETSLYMLIETAIGPLWVFLAGYEIPPPFTIYGECMYIHDIPCEFFLCKYMYLYVKWAFIVS